MSKIDEAIAFAAKAHEGQNRKGTDIPYISHPYAVAMLLQQADCNEDVVIAGLLHDTVEDTNVTSEEIAKCFGDRVSKFVTAASESDKSLPWKKRKEHTLEFLAMAPLDVRHLICADKLHNLRSILADLNHAGTDLWARFNSGRDEQEWYYSGIAESLYTELPQDVDLPLFAAYRHAVVELRRVIQEERRTEQEDPSWHRDTYQANPVPMWKDGVGTVRQFAQEFEGYDVFGGRNVLRWLQGHSRHHFEQTGGIPHDYTFEDLRGCLFMVQRGWHAQEQSGPMTLSEDFVAYVKALLDAIRSRMNSNGNLSQRR
jgi:hypothetical protein